MMSCGRGQSLKVLVLQAHNRAKQTESPFRDPSGKVNSPAVSAGSISVMGNVQTRNVPSNTSVPTAVRNMLPMHVGNRNETLDRITSPVKVDNLSKLLSGFTPTDKDILISGFKNGFRLGSNKLSYSNLIPKNHQSVTNEPDIVSTKILKEINMQRYLGPFDAIPFDNVVISPLGLVPKKELNSYRLIHDLSFPEGFSVNSDIPQEASSVQYQNIENAIHLVKENGYNCLMAKADIEEAFRQIPINPMDRHLLGLSWNNHFYFDACLPFGSSSSCQLFEKFSSALQWILENKFNVKSTSHLLDDFCFVGKAGSRECHKSLFTFFAVCEALGVPIKKEKTVLPSTVLTIYGIELDSNLMMARLPEDKLQKMRSLLAAYKSRRKLTLRELQSLIGLLNFACSVIVPGRAFLRRLIDFTVGIVKPHHRIRLTSEARADLLAWETFILQYNGRSCFHFDKWVVSDSIRLYTDAAGVHGGFAAVLGHQWFSGPWPTDMQSLHITIKELFPIVLAIEIWGHLLKNHKILFMTDNLAVVHIINKTTSRIK